LGMFWAVIHAQRKLIFWHRETVADEMFE